uniref:Uncharacterized protein n=1 Tax=Staphylococcus aureus TaxID=1280 RepID=D2J886_STAAU|nr:hypothetical protein SAP040A_004 [Staphylococcus aureus]
MRFLRTDENINKKFIQHNDYKNYKTHYQCSRCLSFDVDKQGAYSSYTFRETILTCNDCHLSGSLYKRCKEDVDE